MKKVGNLIAEGLNQMVRIHQIEALLADLRQPLTTLAFEGCTLKIRPRRYLL